MTGVYLPWEVLVLGWSVGWVFSLVIYVSVYTVAGSWRKFYESC